MLVSVFDRFDGKTPSRGVCDAIARAFTRSPVRDPTRRALARERPDDALAIKTRAAAPVAATPTFPKTPRVLLPGADIGDCPPHADPVDAGALSLARSPRDVNSPDSANVNNVFQFFLPRTPKPKVARDAALTSPCSPQLSHSRAASARGTTTAPGARPGACRTTLPTPF